MCATCGCGDDAGIRISTLEGVLSKSVHTHGHNHDNNHDHGHESGHHDHHHHGETVTLEQNLLAKNNLAAARNRGRLEGRGIRALNVMSSPGAGKTTLLVRTIEDLAGRIDIQVIEGDQETLLDADRIRATGRPVIQINTGAGCHLDGEMVKSALDALGPAPGATVFIENVGNLVCPALFDLGETARVVVISVTEGDDKPLKYPHMFLSADLVIINKADLLPYVEFDVELCSRLARLARPGVDVLLVSATTGEGLSGWYDWLTRGPVAATPAEGSASPPQRLPV